jgi:hypothetical protein
VLENLTFTQVQNKCQTITVISLFTDLAELVFHLTTNASNTHRYIYLKDPFSRTSIHRRLAFPDIFFHGPEKRSRYSESLESGRSGIRNRMRKRFYAPLQTSLIQPFTSSPSAESKAIRAWHWPSNTNHCRSEGRSRALPLLSLCACIACSLTYGLPTKILSEFVIPHTRYISCVSILIRLPQKWTGKSATQEHVYLEVFFVLLWGLCLALIYCLQVLLHKYH